jgi:hypothetical protein
LLAYQEQVRFAQVATVRAIQKTSSLSATDAAAQIEGLLNNYQKLGLGSSVSSSLFQEETTQFSNLVASLKTTTTV